MTDEQLNEWAALQAKDTGRLAREILELREALTKIRDNDPDSWEASVARAALEDKP